MDTTHARTNTPRDAHRRGYEIPVCVYKTKTKPHEVVLGAIDPARAIDSIVIPAHSETTIMSALLASSFVGRVAAFKATKVQVRFFRGTSRRERRANGATRAPSSREGTNARKCASVAGDRRTKSIGASRRARERERGDRRGRWVRGKRYARAFTARTRRGAAWTRARAPAHGQW